MLVRRLAVLVPLVAMAGEARAEVGQCHVVDVKFTPAMVTSTPAERHEPSQIVVWVETPAGEYKGTVFITAQTGRFGLGNRPGRFDFNSGPLFPYGRRTTTFPVWAHRHGQGPLGGLFPQVIFQNVEGFSQGCVDRCIAFEGKPQAQCELECANPPECETPVNDGTGQHFALCGENNLSHPFDESSRELHYCQPFRPNEPKWIDADAMTCATMAFTDKGKFSQGRTSPYPPRVDLVRGDPDSASVDMFRAMNPFDAISQATPPSGAPFQWSWPIPQDLSPGDYVMWVEVSQAYDHNATYSVAAYPAPPSSGPQGIFWYDYGLPYRGQPSIVYKVPFTIGTQLTTATTADYAGYGDPDGRDGDLRAPDATITIDTPGSGASRLALVSEGGTMYRVLVRARPEIDHAVPGTPDDPRAMSIEPTRATIRFIAPGDDGLIGRVTGYEIRYLANREMTEATFAEGQVALATVTPEEPGRLQTVEISGLLPETDYWVGIRALDDCHNTSPLAIVKLTTADRPVGTVDACFVATAAYGTVMANDVERLRHFRDALLQRTVLGELAVETYYTFGPALAGVVGESDLLRRTAREILRPLVAWVGRLSV